MRLIVMLFIDLMSTKRIFVLALLCFALLAAAASSANAAQHSECGESPTLKYREYAKKIGKLFISQTTEKKLISILFYY